MKTHTECPRCGEQENIFWYAKVQPPYMDVYRLCKSCWARFDSFVYEMEESKNPFTQTKKESEDK